MQSTDESDISATQAAELIGVTSQAVRDLVRKGELPGWRKLGDAPNGPFYGPRSAVEAYLKRRDQKQKTE